MKIEIKIAAAVMAIGYTCIGYAAETETQSVKDAARATCLAEAKKNYTSAEIVSTRAKKKKVGKMRGYAFTVKVKKPKKSLVCIANAEGETLFYRGTR